MIVPPWAFGLVGRAAATLSAWRRFAWTRASFATAIAAPASTSARGGVFS